MANQVEDISQKQKRRKIKGRPTAKEIPSSKNSYSSIYQVKMTKNSLFNEKKKTTQEKRKKVATNESFINGQNRSHQKVYRLKYKNINL